MDVNRDTFGSSSLVELPRGDSQCGCLWVEPRSSGQSYQELRHSDTSMQVAATAEIPAPSLDKPIHDHVPWSDVAIRSLATEDLLKFSSRQE
jgi:hypothetical protein